jgi:hypothetical protein
MTAILLRLNMSLHRQNMSLKQRNMSQHRRHLLVRARLKARLKASIIAGSYHMNAGLSLVVVEGRGVNR